MSNAIYVLPPGLHPAGLHHCPSFLAPAVMLAGSDTSISCFLPQHDSLLLKAVLLP